MPIVEFIQEHGYWALFVGAFLEGELVLLAAGFLVHRGYLEPFWAFVFALTGTYASDQCYFFLGRLLAKWLRGSRPALAVRALQTGRRIRRHQWKVIFGFRFLYGARVIVPFLIGAARYPIRRFVPIDAVAATVWTLLAGTVGYVLGEALAALLPSLRRFEIAFIVTLVLTAVVFKLILWYRHRRRERRSESRQERCTAPPSTSEQSEQVAAGPPSKVS